MNLPLPPTASAVAAFRTTQEFQPLHDRLTPRWERFPASARDAMHRTLGHLTLTPLPGKAKSQLLRQQTMHPVVPSGSSNQEQPGNPVTTVAPHHAVSHFPTPLGFVALLSAYRSTGGTVRGDDLSRHVRSDAPGHLTNLARKLVSGAILSFSWRQTLWVPLFQFEDDGSEVKPAVTRILGELAGAFDSWEIAMWFVQPNSSLNEQRPVDLLDSHRVDVLQAARVDRFVAVG